MSFVFVLCWVLVDVHVMWFHGGHVGLEVSWHVFFCGSDVWRMTCWAIVNAQMIAGFPRCPSVFL